MKTALEMIAEQCRKNVEKGYTPEHDDEHDVMQLSCAAGCYLANATNQWIYENTHTDREVTTRHQVCNSYQEERAVWMDAWPFPDFDNRSQEGVIESLIHAGALIVAEIDRLNRQNQSTQ